MNKVTKNPFARIQKVTAVTLCIVCSLFYMASSCGNSQMRDIENADCASCENKKILKELKDEPAFITKKCFEHVGRVDTFYFQLVNSHSEFHGSGVFPCGEIPEQYRKDGLSVYISGNVTGCLVPGGCIEPNIKLAAINLLELKTIKLNNQ